MKKKLVGAIFCVFLIASGAVPVIGVNVTNFEDLTERYLDVAANNNTTYILGTAGPISSFFTEITLHDGPSSQINKINRLVNRKVLHFLLPFAKVWVNDLNFTVSYKRDVLFNISRFSYGTILYDIENESVTNRTYIINTIHTVNVKGFTGFFILTRAKLRRLSPAYFVFSGEYEDILIMA